MCRLPDFFEKNEIMKKNQIVLFLAMCIGVLAVCGADARQQGRYDLKVAEFSKIELVDGFNLEYHCSDDSAGMIHFVTDRATASKILFEVKKDRLVIQKDFHDEDSMVSDLPTLHVYSRFLTDVKNCGDSTLVVNAPKSVVKFSAEVIGNGRIVVRDIDCSKFNGSINTGNGTLVASGRCVDATLSNTGVGTIQCDRLQADNASCRFFGKGTTGVWVTGTLQVKGVLPGKCYYRGTPQTIKNYAVGVKIIPLDNLPDE